MLVWEHSRIHVPASSLSFDIALPFPPPVHVPSQLQVMVQAPAKTVLRSRPAPAPLDDIAFKETDRFDNDGMGMGATTHSKVPLAAAKSIPSSMINDCDTHGLKKSFIVSVVRCDL